MYMYLCIYMYIYVCIYTYICIERTCARRRPSADFAVPGGPNNRTCSCAIIPSTTRRDSSSRSTNPSPTVATFNFGILKTSALYSIYQRKRLYSDFSEFLRGVYLPRAVADYTSSMTPRACARAPPMQVESCYTYA